MANVGTIDIGNAEDGDNGGKALATEMFRKLWGMCDEHGCKGDHQEMDDVEAVIDDGEEPLKPAMYIDDAVYKDLGTFDKMLSVGLASWVSALENDNLKLCKDVVYEAEADETGSGCGKGPIPTSRVRRKVRRDDGAVLWEREGLMEAQNNTLSERCVDCDRPKICHYRARMCNAPDSITVVADTGDGPCSNHITISVALDKTGDGFDCEAIVEGLTVLTAALAPELLELEALEGVELESICGQFEEASSAIASMTSEKVKVNRRQNAKVPPSITV